MKICMLIDTFLPNIGGAEIHVLELGRALTARGHQIEVSTATAAEEEAGDDEFLVLRLAGLAGGGWRALLQIPFAIPRLVRLIRRADIIHCHYSFLFAALGTLLGRFLGKPSVITLHGLGTLDSSVEHSVLFRLYRFVSMRLSSFIIATSEEMRRVALRFAPPERIRLIPNGVDTERFIPRPGPDSGRKIILAMRRLAPKNGVQYLVEAAPEIIRSVPQAHFWITGEGKLEDHIRCRVAELGLEGHVRFLGIIPHAQTPQYYQQADVVVFPSSAESTSLACLEAMSMEKAVVASRLAVYQEMLGADERGVLADLFQRDASDYNAPLTLPAERISSLARAVIRVITGRRLSHRLGRAARLYVLKHYSWRLIAGQTEKVYQGLLA